VMRAWWWTLFVARVGDEGGEECEEEDKSVHVGQIVLR
jgi:hypothetical protein